MKLLSRYIIAAGFFIIATSMILQKSKRVIFFGDSITQMGVNPGGYIVKMGEMLEQKGLSKEYELLGLGYWRQQNI